MLIHAQGITGIIDPFLHADYVSASTGGWFLYGGGCFILIGFLLLITIFIIILSVWRRKKKKQKAEKEHIGETAPASQSSSRLNKIESDALYLP